ncbi:nuclear transport factor 2 family protein [Flavobacterium sp. MAH-1]|uniref:Nuclear transport factor 2 family protein n=1 Tax=Flavobacterium agri TaxID=2743471 RepID=A0A7Y8Y0R3_9FLAO|nr:nuclear transport factor 2 family protein [Flavobacterium agri]NUY80256.1 nuclear transport factor 2 family protein [Flavobacterium agri]NYA70281.1 nuclear transport factor 2 family protein [Flavobacterium agri]
MKYVYFLLLFVSASVFSQKSDIDKILNDWHKAAADGNFNGYFGAFTSDAIFIGTEAAENWNMEQFKAFSKPYFDKGKAWDFKPVERHIYLSADGKMAWFDELLDTWMKICRGSGVLVKENDKWKIKHYVLSMTIPNDDVDGVIKIISKNEDAYLEKLKQKK